MKVRQFDSDILWNNAYKILMALTLIAVALAIPPAVNAESTPKTQRPVHEYMVVYKSPTCGCCGAWVDHVNEAGFSTKIHHPKDMNTIKDQLGVSPVYQACHTAAHSGYVFEGHIPADVIEYFLAKKPDALGLAVPGMPMGSPGMDTNGNFRPYQVLQLNNDGSSTPYAKVSASKTMYLGKN
jgi:hypothetical protein